MRPLNALIAAQSVELRSKIKEALDSTGLATVSKIAPGGKLALQMLEHGSIDIVIVDAGISDISFLEFFDVAVSRGFNVHFIVVAANPMAAARESKDRLKHSRLHFIETPKIGGPSNPIDLKNMVRELRDTLEKCQPRAVAQSSSPQKIVDEKKSHSAAPVSRPPRSPVNLDQIKPHIICLGSSTGGPAALEVALGKLAGKSRVPILVVQHMPAGFTEALAGRLQTVSGLPAAEAKPGESLQVGRIYVAPGDFHMRVVKDNNDYCIHLDKGPKRNSVRPAVDFLFESAAQIFMKNTVAMVLTGMGEDGLAGSKVVKKLGGAVIIQDKESSVVWGMPGAIHDAGSYDAMADLDKCATLLAALAVRR